MTWLAPLKRTRRCPLFRSSWRRTRSCRSVSSTYWFQCLPHRGRRVDGATWEQTVCQLVLLPSYASNSGFSCPVEVPRPLWDQGRQGLGHSAHRRDQGAYLLLRRQGRQDNMLHLPGRRVHEGLGQAGAVHRRRLLPILPRQLAHPAPAKYWNSPSKSFLLSAKSFQEREGMYSVFLYSILAIFDKRFFFFWRKNRFLTRLVWTLEPFIRSILPTV